jgi:hypothetical protein
MAARTAGHDDTLLHLVPDEAEASLCRIPRAGLGPTTDSDHIVCPECIDWLPKRTRFSEEFQKVPQS